MRSDENNIDNFFRSKYIEFEADTTNKTTHWQQMDHLLNDKVIGSQSPVIWKRTTRRIITYLGAAAVVTTVIYYSITNKQSVVKKGLIKTESVKTLDKPVEKNNNRTMVIKSQNINDVSKKSNSTIAKHKLYKPSAPYNINSIVVRKIKEVSDTVFQKDSPGNIYPPLIINNFYDGIRQPVQFFTIDPARDTLLFGRNGTVLKIPAYAFADRENKIIKTPLQFELTECYSYPDMFAYNLATTAGKEQLITGGMIRLGANADGKDLKLLQYKSLNIGMPMEQYDPEMQLFIAAPENKWEDVFNKESTVEADVITSYSPIYFGPAGFDWKPADQQQGYKNLTPYVERKNIKLFELRQIIKAENEKSNVHYLIKANDNLPDDKIKELIRSKYLSQFTRLTFERVKNFSQEVDAKNTNAMMTQTGFVAADFVYMDFQQAFKEGLVSKQDSLEFMIQLNKEKQLYIERIRKDSIAYVKQKNFEKMYNFNISDLGWINCDKFYKSDQPKIEFSINIGSGIDQLYGNYKLVFTNIRSILPGRFENGKVYFGKVPVNEPVQVVCVSQKNGKAIACIRSIKVTKNAIATLQFEEMTATTFKEKLSGL